MGACHNDTIGKVDIANLDRIKKSRHGNLSFRGKFFWEVPQEREWDPVRIAMGGLDKIQTADQPTVWPPSTEKD